MVVVANWFRLAVAAVAMLLLPPLGSPPAAAVDYPTRSITIVVSHTTGGPADVIARVLGGMLAPVLRQPLVIENRPGAAGAIAAEQTANAAPDGYTLMLGNTSNLATNPIRPKSASLDPQLDFTPITLIGTQSNVLVVNPDLPVRTLTELIELAQAKPRAITFASAGHGSPPHLAGEMFKARTRADMVHVPYKKPGPALQDVVGGHVKMMFAPAALVANHIRAGRLRALGVASKTRSPLLPGVATIDELGLVDFDATTWYGLVGPPGVPRDIVEILYHATGAVLEDPAARKILAGLGIDAIGSTPREFETYIRVQIPKWAAVIRSITTQTH